MNSKQLLFELHGFKVYSDSTYVVRDKEDLDAPSGFIEAGVTKLPSDGVDVSFQCFYKRTSQTTGIWDTGFHVYSPCYENVYSKEEREIIVNNLIEKVVEPYRQSTGIPNALDHGNDEFWNKTNFVVYTGQVFNTNNPKDVVDLYFGLLTKNLTPKGQEGDTKFNESPYVVVDINQDNSSKDEKVSNYYEAIGIFEGLLKNDKKRLISILNYCKLVVSEEIEDSAFRGLFNQHLTLSRDSNTNTEMFLKVYEESTTDTGREVIELYSKLKKASVRSSKLTRNPNGIYYYEDAELGPDLKASAINIARSKELEHIKKELLFEENLENEN